VIITASSASMETSASEVACGSGMCEGCEQALVGFRGSGKRALFLRDVFSRTFEELAVRGLLLADQLRNVVYRS
jgi:hypothetical protein